MKNAIDVFKQLVDECQHIVHKNKCHHIVQSFWFCFLNFMDDEYLARNPRRLLMSQKHPNKNGILRFNAS